MKRLSAWLQDLLLWQMIIALWRQIQWPERLGLHVLWRVPAALLAACFIALAIYAGAQARDIATGLAFDPVRLYLATIGALLLIALAHLAFIARFSKRFTLFDAALASIPLAIMAYVVGAVGPAGDLGASAGVLAIGAVFLIGPHLTAEAPRWSKRGFLVAGAAFVACLILTLTLPVDFPRALGPLGVLSIGLGLLSVGIASLLLNKWIGIIVTIVGLGSFIIDGTTHDVRRLPPITQEQADNRPQADFTRAFVDWLKHRGDLAAYKAAGRPYPVIMVAAQGGGIYAAAHTYAALRHMQDYCPNFARHLFAAAGVSGGSWGLALFDASLPDTDQSTALAPCSDGANLPRLQAEGHFLAGDFLSPVLATFFFVETVNAVLPGKYLRFDRAEALELAFERTTEVNEKFLQKDVLDVWSGDGDRPALAFVSTDVHFGERYTFMPLLPDFDTLAEYFNTRDEVAEGGMRVSTAAGISSRFPWLTPAARLTVAPSPSTDTSAAHDQAYIDAHSNARLLLDGGFFENSATETDLDLLRSIEQMSEISTQCVIERAKPDHPNPYLCRASDRLLGAGCTIRIEPFFSTPTSWDGCTIPIYLYYLGTEGYHEVDCEPNAKPDSCTEDTPGGSMTGAHFYRDPVASQSFLTDPISALTSVRTGRGLLASERMQAHALGRNLLYSAPASTDSGYDLLILHGKDDGVTLNWNMSESVLQRVFDDAEELRNGCAPAARLRSPEGCMFDNVATLLDLSRTPISIN